MKTPSQQLKESLEEFVEKNNKSIAEMVDYGSTTKDFYQRLKVFITTHTIELLEAEIERLKNQEIKEYQIRIGGWKGIINQLEENWSEDLFVESIKDTHNQALSDQISHLQEQIIKIKE